MEIIKVEHLKDYKLRVHFSDGAVKVINMKKFLMTAQNPMTTQFRDVKRFKKAYIDMGHLTWEDGQMDISAQSVREWEE